jgi:hypothetical protein
MEQRCGDSSPTTSGVADPSRLKITVNPNPGVPPDCGSGASGLGRDPIYGSLLGRREALGVPYWGTSAERVLRAPSWGVGGRMRVGGRVCPRAIPRLWRAQYFSESVGVWTIRFVCSVGSIFFIARFDRITEVAFLCQFRDLLPLCQTPDPDPVTPKRWPSLPPNDAISRFPEIHQFSPSYQFLLVAFVRLGLSKIREMGRNRP